MKISMKRLAALVLALVMVIGLMPVMSNTVEAAVVEVTGLSDSSIGLSAGKADKWIASEDSINGSITGANPVGTAFRAASDTLTIKNTKSSAATLSFDFAVTLLNTGSKVTIDGTEYKANTTGSFSKELGSGASIDILLSAAQNRAGANTVSIAITKLRLLGGNAGPLTTTFEAPAFGSYTVAYGSETKTVAAGTASVSATNESTVEYTLTANPGAGYKFIGWYNVTTGSYVSTANPYVASFDTAYTIKAVIVSESAPIFMVDKNYYADLNEAVDYATANGHTKITLHQSGTLSAVSGGYTIPAGITLLIPMDDKYTVTGTNDMGIAPEAAIELETPYAYRTLTMAEGATLTVNGTVDIEAKHLALQGGAGKRIHGGRVCGAYGAIYMSPNSTITLNSGAILYAWGFVYGEGTMTANSGAQVYEIMQVNDFPGGNKLAGFVDKNLTDDTSGDGIPDNDYLKTFPFTQYYVQNIEVALTLMHGAAEYIFTTIHVSGVSVGTDVEFIGANGMFIPKNGSITKDYDPSTDRLIVEVNGDASVSSIVLDMSDTEYAELMHKFIGSDKFDSSRYILNLNSNITININTGTTTLDQDMGLLPGVEVYVDRGATLEIAQQVFGEDEYNNLTVFGSAGHNVYVWDQDHWGTPVFDHVAMLPATYSPTVGRYVRNVGDLKDALVDVNGTVISNGFLYSTVKFDNNFNPISGGASIISSGKTGKIVLQAGAGTEDFAFCLDGSSAVDSQVSVDSVWLKNGDGTFVLTDGAAEGAIYDYCARHDKWYTGDCEDCATPDSVEITWIVNGEAGPQDVEYGTTPVYPGGTPTKAQVGCTAYTFAGWSTSANGAVLETLPLATEDAVYYAIFTSGISHTGELEYTHVDEWSHKVTYGCCGAVVHEAEKHQQLQDGYCVCGDVLILLSVSDVKIFGEELESSSLFIYVKAGSTYTLDLAPADGWQKVCVEIYDYSTYTVDATLNATQLVLGPEYTSAFNENLMISISSYWDIIYDLNGGEITDELKDFIPEGVYDSENGSLTMYMPSGAFVNFITLKEMYFVREGYTLIGVTDGETTYTGEEDIAPNGEDLHLSLIWKADHVCSENLTEVEAVEPDCDSNGVKAYWVCSCGKYYADANASTEIADLAAWKKGDGKIEKLGHGHTAGLYYEECDEDTHNIYCNDCDEAIEGNVRCTDTVDDGDHKCDFCPNDNITGHSYDAVTHICECGAVETFTVTWLLNGGILDEQTKQMLINEGFIVTDTSISNTFPYGDFAPAAPGVDKTGHILMGFTDQYGKSYEGQDVFTLAEDMTFTMVWAAKTYTLTVETPNGNVDLYVSYGTNLLEALAQAAAKGKIPAKGDRIRVNEVWANGEYYVSGYYCYVPSYSLVENNSTMPAENITVWQQFYTYGWTKVDTDGDSVTDSWQYADPEKGQLGEGWHYIEEDYDDVPGGGWYYFQHKLYSDVRVEGLTRVPYNPELGYGPDQEAMDYCANKGTTFIDATEAWFVFGENGKFQADYTGPVIDGEYARYAVNGHIAWHVGLIENQGAYFYFTGDEVNGGNVMVAGRDYYLSRNNTELNVTIGGIYTFGVDGALCRFHGISESDLFEGKRYYIGSRLMVGAGLVDKNDLVDGEWVTNYFYVDSYGQLILDAEYYIGANNLGIEKGIYYFDAEGFLVLPEEEPGKDGFYFEDGNWYYYVAGVKGYCAGLISTARINWYETPDAEGVENLGWVYVKSNGALATGIYYVTNVNDPDAPVQPGEKRDFGADGLLQITKNGIVDGYYYENGSIVYGAGLIEIDGDYYYVRSNGQIVTDRTYWATKVNETGFAPAEYYFDADGKLVLPEEDTFTGVREGYYYENGAIAYGAGLIEIEGGKYIYVRSNGQLATGLYWTTNHNGELAEGYYDFGEDGILVIE